MSFVLRLQDIIVGRSDLAQRDPDSRTACGVFRPGLGYELVEPIFGLRDLHDEPSEAQQARYRRARETLALSVYDSAGSLVETSRIEILADPHAPNRLVLDVTVVDNTFWSAV